MKKATQILIVDDNAGFLELYGELLAAHGFEVAQASTGHQGIRLARELRPYLVLLDVVLPDIDGIEVCRQIKSDPALEDVFVVLITGEATSSAQKVSGFGIGADDFLLKPIGVDELLARIRSILRLRATTAALRASELHYRQLIEILPDPMALIAKDGTLAAVNQRAIAMFGYSAAEELLSRNFTDFIKAEDQERFGVEIAKALAHRSMTKGEYTLLWRGTHSVSVELNAAVVGGSDDRPFGIVALMRDTTERKWAERLMQVQRDFGIFLSSTKKLETALDRLLTIALQQDGIDCGVVFSVEPESLLLAIAGWQGFSRDLGLKTRQFADRILQLTGAANLLADHAGVPSELKDLFSGNESDPMQTLYIRHGGELVALLLIGARFRGAIPADSLRAVQAIAAEIGDALARIRAEDQLRSLPRRILEAQEAERKRVARELHDGVNQVIASVKMRLRNVRDRIAATDPATREILVRCEKLLVHALEENRRIAYNLRPGDLDELGLTAACRNFCREFQTRTMLKVTFSASRINHPLPPEADLHLFRMMQEALANVERHARAKVARVSIRLRNGVLFLTIRDDGKGLPDKTQVPDKKRTKGGGLGLPNLHERAASLGGTIEIISQAGRGTAITVRVPLVKRTLAKRGGHAQVAPVSTQQTA